MHTVVVNETEWAMLMAALLMYAQACKDNGEDAHSDNANTLASRLFVEAVEHSAKDDTTSDICGYTGYDEVDEDGKLVPVYDDTEAMYAANVAYEDRVNPAVWDQAVANDSNAWCDSCGRMKAYCTCNERL